MLKSLYVKTLVGSRVALGVETPESLTSYLELLRSLYYQDIAWNLETLTRASVEMGLYPSIMVRVVGQLLDQNAMGEIQGHFWFRIPTSRRRPFVLKA